MIIFAKRLRERPTECTLDGIIRHPQTLSLYNHRKNYRPKSNIHGCGLTKKVNMKCITKVMNGNAKCKHVCFQSYTFTLYIVCRLSNNQTTKEKMKASFQRNQCKKNKRLCLIEIKHTYNQIYVIIGLQRAKQSNIQSYMYLCKQANR